MTKQTISERYGVETPDAALRRIIVERLDPEQAPGQADAILAEYREAQLRYQRAVRVDKARRAVWDARLRKLPREDWKPWLVKSEALVAHARTFIETGEVSE